MKKIKLGKDKYVVVDNKDFLELNKFKWYCTSHGYARRVDKNGKHLYMHRIIMKFPKKHCVDHIDGNKLNNCRKNLRIVTTQQNLFNRHKIISSSGITGVYWNKLNKNWRAIITFNYKPINIGSFNVKTDAILARKKAELKYFNYA